MPRPKSYKLTGQSGVFKDWEVYYIGFPSQPSFLPKSGRGFSGLRHILERLKAKYKRFTLTITPDDSSVRKDGSTYKVRLSGAAITRLGKNSWPEKRSLMLNLTGQMLAQEFPHDFGDLGHAHVYRRGMFAEILTRDFDVRRLSPEDKRALSGFLAADRLAGADSSLDVPTVYRKTRDAQLLYVKRLVTEFRDQLARGHAESWWQNYFRENLLYFQESYIQILPKLNVQVGTTQYPDFLVATSDGFLDVIEIKTPGTELLREDASRHNYYMTTEIAKALAQVENYVDSITKQDAELRVSLRRDAKLDLRVIRPRGIIIAGKTTDFKGEKMADDFRRLNQGLRHVQILPFDELATRLENTMVSIERLAKQGASQK